tara:strand:- start:212 stop:430 length:219 start_codon:yes stop_codon:yes gene_type:complete
MENLEKRIIELEIQLTHQAKTMEELSDTIISQQKRLDKLLLIVEFLSKAVTQNSEDQEELPNIFDLEKPPHY